MHDEEDFLRVIISSPDEDTPRLVFADWLEETGDHDRAAFIRLQIRQAQLEPGHPDATPAPARCARVPHWGASCDCTRNPGTLTTRLRCRRLSDRNPMRLSH